jgi:hypothetical protein
VHAPVRGNKPSRLGGSRLEGLWPHLCGADQQLHGAGRADAVIMLGADVLTLHNVQTSTLQAADFLLA